MPYALASALVVRLCARAPALAQGSGRCERTKHECGEAGAQDDGLALGHAQLAAGQGQVRLIDLAKWALVSPKPGSALGCAPRHAPCPRPHLSAG
jgi:hypothetical protein